jgi:hypothetical protein
MIVNSPSERDGHATLVIDDRLILFGGDRRRFSYNDLYELDLFKLNEFI